MFDASGVCYAEAYEASVLLHPAPGAVEQDPDALYAALRDNDPAAENRCVEVGGENAQAALLRKNILTLIRSYDYAAALTLAESAP